MPETYNAVVGRQSYHGSGHVAHHFDDAAQQKESAFIGMWAFLATEVLFFGALFCSYAVYRHHYPVAFVKGSNSLSFWLGTINTGVLLCSSFAMAMAVHSAATGNRTALVGFLILTMLLGLAFLGIKATEYYTEWQDHLVPYFNFSFEGDRTRELELFFCFYFIMTAIHALHMIIGITIMAILTVLSYRGKFTAAYHNPIEITGLYWHFVDIVWVFLFPMIYLLRH